MTGFKLHYQQRNALAQFVQAALKQDPRPLGYRATTWTAPLLAFHLRQAHQLRVSLTSVRRALARLDIRWKRPRHTLGLRPKH